jgi:hypothetical protein
MRDCVIVQGMAAALPPIGCELGVNMKIWLARLSGRQRSSQISSKEVERIRARFTHRSGFSAAAWPHNLRRLAPTLYSDSFHLSLTL